MAITTISDISPQLLNDINARINNALILINTPTDRNYHVESYTNEYPDTPVVDKIQNIKRTAMYKYKIKSTYYNYYYNIVNHIDDAMLENIVYETDYHYDLSNKYNYINIPYHENKSLRVRTCHLRLIETTLDETATWSNPRKRILNFDNNYLMDQIRTRYAFLERPTNGLSNIIIDNYAPKLMYLSKLRQSSVIHFGLPKTIYAISPWFAQYFGAQQIPTEHLCRILGYDVNRLKQLILKVKRNDWSISFVGYGGTGVNTIYWLTEIMKVTQSVNLFKFIEIFEPDNIEISNLLRFPKNPFIENDVTGFGQHSTSKLRLLEPTELALLSRMKPTMHTNTISGNRLRDSKGTYYNITERKHVTKDKHIFYGAPTIDTRSSFKDIGHFISATHHGNNAHLWLNPTQDSDLQVESYGLIELTPFFMNQLRLAIGLLETLSDSTLNLKDQDKALLECSFDGIAKLPMNKVYNFQLSQHENLVATEAEAATQW